MNKKPLAESACYMYSSSLTQLDSHEPGSYPNQQVLEKETLIAEIERIQQSQMIAEIEHLQVEELEIELRQMKWCSLYKLQQSLRQENFPSAIAYVDSLAQRLPDDLDTRHWQAIAYLRWGRQLAQQKDLKKAECCFNKALNVLPQNSFLHNEIQSELSRIRGHV